MKKCQYCGTTLDPEEEKDTSVILICPKCGMMEIVEIVEVY